MGTRAETEGWAAGTGKLASSGGEPEAAVASWPPCRATALTRALSQGILATPAAPHTSGIAWRESPKCRLGLPRGAEAMLCSGVARLGTNAAILLPCLWLLLGPQGSTHSPVSSGLNRRRPGPCHLHFLPASPWGEDSRCGKESGGAWGCPPRWGPECEKESLPLRAEHCPLPSSLLAFISGHSLLHEQDSNAPSPPQEGLLDTVTVFPKPRVRMWGPTEELFSDLRALTDVGTQAGSVTCRKLPPLEGKRG